MAFESPEARQEFLLAKPQETARGTGGQEGRGHASQLLKSELHFPSELGKMLGKALNGVVFFEAPGKSQPKLNTPLMSLSFWFDLEWRSLQWNAPVN